jgi:hypothetical protein
MVIDPREDTFIPICVYEDLFTVFRSYSLFAVLEKGDGPPKKFYELKNDNKDVLMKKNCPYSFDPDGKFVVGYMIKNHFNTKSGLSLAEVPPTEGINWYSICPINCFLPSYPSVKGMNKATKVNDGVLEEAEIKIPEEEGKFEEGENMEEAVEGTQISLEAIMPDKESQGTQLSLEAVTTDKVLEDDVALAANNDVPSNLLTENAIEEDEEEHKIEEDEDREQGKEEEERGGGRTRGGREGQGDRGG